MNNPDSTTSPGRGRYDLPTDRVRPLQAVAARDPVIGRDVVRDERMRTLRARERVRASSRFADARAAADQYLDDHLDGSDHGQTRAEWIDGLVIAVLAAYEEGVQS